MLVESCMSDAVDGRVQHCAKLQQSTAAGNNWRPFWPACKNLHDQQQAVTHFMTFCSAAQQQCLLCFSILIAKNEQNICCSRTVALLQCCTPTPLRLSCYENATTKLKTKNQKTKKTAGCFDFHLQFVAAVVVVKFTMLAWVGSGQRC